MRALLDVNVLVALFDQSHVHHRLARDWLVGNADAGWSSCPITQNGLVRILSQPAYPGSVSVREAVGLLAGACATSAHEFWSADVSILDVMDPTRIHGPKQLTDAYLVALAVSRGGRLATFDARIPLEAVPNALQRSVLVLGVSS